MTQPDRKILVTLPTNLQERFFTDELRGRLESHGTVDWNDLDRNLEPDEVAERLAGVEVIVTGWGTETLDEEVLARADSLELLIHIGGSLAGITSEPLYDRGVSVCSTNRPMARFVAEFTLAHMTSAMRDLVRSHDSMRNGGYQTFTPRRTLIGASISLIGLGTVGRYLLPLLDPFDVNVRVYDPYVPPVELAEYGFVEKASLDRALTNADVVSIHAARTPETRGMIGASELARIPDGAILVNTARAQIVDEEGLLSELTTGRLRAALDVYHEEPLPEDSPLRDLANVQLTPHIGGGGPRETLTLAAIEELERYIDGRTLQHEIPKARADLMTR